MKSKSISHHKHQQSSHHHHHHGHAHGHGHHHASLLMNDSSSARIALVFLLNLVFTVIEIIGGFWTGSVAILADAVHDAGDCLSLGLALFLQHRSRKGPKGGFSYGYRRLSLVSALVSSVVILSGALFVILESVPRFWEPQSPHGWGMLFLAGLGISANGAGAWLLSRGRSLNEKVLTWHLLEDVLGWGAVLIGAGLYLIFDWPWIDPLLAIGVSVYISLGVIRNLYHTGLLFMQHSPVGLDLEHMKSEILKLTEVEEIHDLHAWSLDGEHHVLSLHVVLAEDGVDPAKLKIRIREVIHGFGEFHSTIEVETKAEMCLNNCQ